MARIYLSIFTRKQRDLLSQDEWGMVGTSALLEAVSERRVKNLQECTPLKYFFRFFERFNQKGKSNHGYSYLSIRVSL